MKPLNIRKLLLTKSQMSARQRSLNHHCVGQPVILFPPVFHNHLRGFHTGHNRHQFRLRRPDNLRQLHGQSSAGYNQINSRRHSRLDVLFVLSGGNHDIDAQNPALCDLPCPGNLRADRPHICSDRVCVKVRFPIADLRRGNHADSALLRHISGKRGEADADSHAALYYRHTGC